MINLHFAPHRLLAWVILGVCVPILFGTGGCQTASRKERKEAERRKKQEKEEEEIAAPNRKSLEVGQRATFEFDPDGVWHPTTVAIEKDQQIQIVVLGEAAQLGDSIVEFRIGRLEQVISPQMEFLVTMPGPLAFRLDPRAAHGFKGTVQVEVARIN